MKTELFGDPEIGLVFEQASHGKRPDFGISAAVSNAVTVKESEDGFQVVAYPQRLTMIGEREGYQPISS